MEYKNILIVKLSAIGDVIHALPVAHALKAKYPDIKITWAVQKVAYDLLTNNPDIDNIVIIDKKQLKTISGLQSIHRELKAYDFDLAIDLQGLFKSSIIAFLSGATERIGYTNMRELSGLVSKPVHGKSKEGHVVDRYLDVARHLGCTIEQIEFPLNTTPQEELKASLIAKEAGLQTNEPYIVLAPGTNWVTKCWPTENFAKLCQLLHEDMLQAVIVGGPNDQNLAQDIITKADTTNIIDLTGKTNLKELSYIIKKANVFMGGDTGPMHMAVAVKTPVVTVFGPTDPKRNGPYQGNNIVLRPDLSCTTCWKKECNKPCLSNITPEEVYSSIKKLTTKTTSH